MIRVHGRGFACGLDTQLDMIARHLGIDPVEIRLRNSRQPGEYTSTKSFVDSCAMDETINKAVEKSDFKNKWGKLPEFHGIGIGTNSVQTGFPMGIRGGSQSFIKFNEDGEATVMTGVVDNGQGNDNMVVQIAAQELGLLPEDIHLVSADTETTSSDPGSYSQVSTFVGGHAVLNAAAKCKKELFKVAAKVLKVDPEKLEAKNRLIFVKDDPEKSIPIKKVVRISLLNFTSVNAEGGYWPKVDMKRECVIGLYH
jgi:4-hydroxybenzoyl-CoA reductase subunit alpha